MVIQFLSILLSADKGTSIDKFIVAQISWTAIFFASAYLFLRPRRVEIWAAMMWGLAIYLSILGLWEWKLHRLPWVGHIPSFLKIADEAVERALSGSMRAFTNRYRVQSTYSTSLGLSEYMALTFPFVLHFLSSRYRLWIRIAAGLSAPLIIYIVILTDSRLGTVGCFISMLIYPLVTAIRIWRRSPQGLLAPAVALAYPAVFCAALAASFMFPHLHGIIWGGASHAPSTQARIDQWQGGIAILKKNPIGHGIGMAAVTLNYQPYGVLTIDSYYLAMLLEFGVIGFLVYFAIIGFGIFEAGWRGLLRRYTDPDMDFFVPIAISLISFFIIKSVFAQQDNHPLIFMMLGMLTALIYRSRSAGAPEPPR